MEYIGFDYHKQHSFATGIDTETGLIRSTIVPNTPEALDSFIRDGVTTHAVLESSRTCMVLYDLLKERVSKVVLAHPLRVKAIASARIKTDKIDSRILAELLESDLIPESHARNEENRMIQKVLRQRVFFVSTRTRVKNRIHWIVDSQPYRIRKTVEGLSDLFGKSGMEWLYSCKEFSESDRILMNQLLLLFETLTEAIVASNKLIDEISSKDKDAQILITMPGIGKFLSVLISTEIDGINRFPSADKLASYTGLVPSTYASGGIIRHGRITKQGNKWLRWAFTEATQSAKRHNAQLNDFFFQRAKRHGKAKASVALARRIVCIVYSMLRDKRPFTVYKEPNYIKKLT